MRRGPSLADYFANPDAYPEVRLAGSTMPRGRRVPMREAPGDTAMRSRTGAPAPTRYERAPPWLPPGPPEWARGMARYAVPVQRMQKPGFPIGPGGVLTAPPPPPEGPATPEPTHYRSMQEAQLANAMMAEPMNPLPDALMAMPEPAGYASGVQSNGMRVPPAPASFGDPGATGPGMGLFGKRPGELTDDRWARALESAQAAAGKRPVTLQDQLFAAIIGGGRRNARR